MEKEYILIWLVNDYAEMGGGTNFNFFETTEQLEEKVNRITQDDRVTISFCGQIKTELEIKPVEKVTKWQIVQ